MLIKRKTSKLELDEIIKYWLERPKCTEDYEEDSLINFLCIFTPYQIKGAMYLATKKPGYDFFKYLCGILHKWRIELEKGNEPLYFDIGKQ